MRRNVLLVLWLLTDAALFIAAYVLAYFLRVGFIVSSDFPLNLYLQTAIIVSPLWLLTLAQLGVFRLLRVQSSRKNLYHILFSCVLGSSIFTLAYYFLHDRFFSRLLLVYAGIFNLILTIIWHLAFDAWQRRILRKSPPAFPVLFIGITRETERLIALLEERQSPLKPIAILEAHGTSKKDVLGIPVEGKLNALEEIIKQKKPTHLIQCSNLEHTVNLMSVCRQHGLTYMLLPSVLGVGSGSEEITSLEGCPVITARG
jgi:FlaA1/EpsC-like NDP-sugar epimerase